MSILQSKLQSLTRNRSILNAFGSLITRVHIGIKPKMPNTRSIWSNQLSYTRNFSGIASQVVPTLDGITVGKDKFGVTVYTGPHLNTNESPSFFQNANLHANSICVSSDSRAFTYAQLMKDASSFSKQLSKLSDGVTFDENGKLVQDKIAFLVQPSYEYVVSMWAIWGMGAVAVPLFPNHPASELEYIISDSQANVLVATEGQLEEKLRPLADKLGKKLVVLKSFSESNANANAKSNSSFMPRPLMPEPVTWSDAVFVYTSGTTGKPKGVRITHGALLAQVAGLNRSWGWTSEDRIRNVLPLHHVHGLINVVLCSLWSGAKVEFLPSEAPQFDAGKEWQRWIDGVNGKEEKLSLFMAVPTIYSHLIREFEKADSFKQEQMKKAAKSFRLMVSGSMALPMPTLERWRDISGHTLLERYGMTEIGMALSNPLTPEKRRPGLVGVPLPGVEVALRSLDEEGEQTAAERSQREGLEDIGELLVRGPSVFKAYWNKPEATRDSFLPSNYLDTTSADEESTGKASVEREGQWFCTGDTAGVDRDGYFKILGRTSVDVLKVSGFKISALDIEREYLSHPDIAEACVLGISNEQYGQTVCMILVPRDKSLIGKTEGDSSSALSLQNLREWGGERMAAYKIPRSIWVVDEIPKNAMGKINKKFLAKQYPTDLLPK